MNLTERLRPIQNFEARRSVVKTNIDSELANMQNPGIENEIRAAWLEENGITDRTKNAIRFGVSHTLAANTRGELFAKLPGDLLLDPRVTRSGKYMEEVIANHNLQQELNNHKISDESLSTEERRRIASLISQLYFTAKGAEGNSTGPLSERLKFIGIAALVITGFIHSNLEGLSAVKEEPTHPEPDQPPEKDLSILDRIDEVL